MKKRRLVPMFVFSTFNLIACGTGGSAPVVSEDGEVDIKVADDYAYVDNIKNAENATKIVIPKEKDGVVVDIKYGALKGCKKLKSLTIPFVGSNTIGQTEEYIKPAYNVKSTSNGEDGNDEAKSAPEYTSFGSIFGNEYYEGSSLITQGYNEISDEVYSVFSEKMENYRESDEYEDSYYLESSSFGKTSIHLRKYPSLTEKVEQAAAYEAVAHGVVDLNELVNGESNKSSNFRTISKSYIPDTLEEVTISGGDIYNGSFSGLTNLKVVNIGADVTSIDPYAFANCVNLEQVNIDPECKATIIGEGAFYNCVNLNYFHLPNSVEYINRFAFYNCQSLSDFELSTRLSNLRNIDDLAFKNCSLTSFTAPHTLDRICYGAFANNTYLTEVEADNVYEISDYAFYNCYNLNKVTTPNVTTIGDLAFGDCASLSKLILEDEELTEVYSQNSYEIGTRAFYNCTSLEEVTIPCRFGAIHEAAFKNCTKLTKVDFEYDSDGEYGIELIDRYAFKNTNINSLSFPVTLEMIGDNAFEKCLNLSNVRFDKGTSSLDFIGDRAFYNCPNLKYINLPTKYDEDADYGLFGKYAFKNNESLYSISIPSTVTTIDVGCFENCKNLETVSIPEGVTTIRRDAFKNCTSLTSISIPRSVQTIETGAFSGCTGLLEVIFENNSLFGIGDCYGSRNIPMASVSQSNQKACSPFIGCSNLNTINFGKNSALKYLSRSMFAGTENSLKNVIFGEYDLSYLISVAEDGSVASINMNRPYYSDKILKDIGDIGIISKIDLIVPGIEVIGQFVIGSNTFAGFKNLTNVQLPYYKYTDAKGDNYLGDYFIIENGAFADCNEIESINIPAPFYLFDDRYENVKEFSWCYQQHLNSKLHNSSAYKTRDTSTSDPDTYPKTVIVDGKPTGVKNGCYVSSNNHNSMTTYICQNSFAGWGTTSKGVTQTINIYDNLINPSIYYEVVASDNIFRESFVKDPLSEIYLKTSCDFLGWNLADLMYNEQDKSYHSNYWGKANIKFNHTLDYIQHSDLVITTDVNTTYASSKLEFEATESAISYSGEGEFNNIPSFINKTSKENTYSYLTPTGPNVKVNYDINSLTLTCKASGVALCDALFNAKATLVGMIEVNYNGTVLTLTAENVKYNGTATGETEGKLVITIGNDILENVLPTSITVKIK